MKKSFKIYLNRNIGYLMVSFLSLFYFSCNSTGDETEEFFGSEKSKSNLVLTPGEYVRWVKKKENGLKKEKTIDDVTFSLQYKPYPYIVCMEEKKERFPDSLLNKRISELDGMQYFDLVISLKSSQGELLKYKIGSSEDYDKRVKYFAFEMQNDIKLVEKEDTLPCSLFHFERTYDVAPYCTFLLGFSLDKNKQNNEKTIILYDRMFDKGTVKFTFNKKEITNIPKLNNL